MGVYIMNRVKTHIMLINPWTFSMRGRLELGIKGRLIQANRCQFLLHHVELALCSLQLMRESLSPSTCFCSGSTFCLKETFKYLNRSSSLFIGRLHQFVNFLLPFFNLSL
uniref:Uncharacterized protein n=1 Tax=Opuntia streptacantha TaxID=393608 RepID=A0A7C9CLY5_OPUST